MNLRIERTTVDKIGDDLERTWRRIESDMSTEMQSSLGILKEVLGYHWDEPVVAVWDNEDLVGVAVYETYDDKDLGTRETYIKMLASFTHEPGIGRVLVGEVISLAREEGCQNVTLSHGPGTKGFYKEMGFVEDTRLHLVGEIGTLMMYKLESENPITPTGTCYPDAWRYVMHHTEATLVHGSVVGLQGRMDHAWAELPDGTLWDPAAQSILQKDRYYGLMDPIVDAFYTADEAALMLSIGQHGPWTAEERMEHIGRSL